MSEECQANYGLPVPVRPEQGVWKRKNLKARMRVLRQSRNFLWRKYKDGINRDFWITWHNEVMHNLSDLEQMADFPMSEV